MIPNRALCKRGSVTPNGKNRARAAPVVDGLFFPQSKRLGIDLGNYSPDVLQRTIYAATHSPSFAQASDALRQLAELDIPTKQVERLARRIGKERCAERDAEVQAYRDLPLVERKAVPAGVTVPSLAVAQMDGGRLQILDSFSTVRFYNYCPAKALRFQEGGVAPQISYPAGQHRGSQSAQLLHRRRHCYARRLEDPACRAAQLTPEPKLLALMLDLYVVHPLQVAHHIRPLEVVTALRQPRL
jgi:hypothetical protein